MEDIGFKFSYLALKLLGKNLYSNAWAALSELVANGLDANASEVYVYVDMRNNRESVIEVFDNGNGMSFNELKDNYVHIGRNRRLNQTNSENAMGRKGIGKLAALYLSRHYYVLSKKYNEDRYIYEMDFSKEKEDSNEDTPKMTAKSEVLIDNENFLSFKSGTMIRMENVDLKGYGEVSRESLTHVLSDFFSVDNMTKQNIFLKIVVEDDDLLTNFEKVNKSVPFKNMVKIICFDEETYKNINGKIKGNIYKLPFKKYENKQFSKETDIELEYLDKHYFAVPNNPKLEKEGILKGWIGIHSSIETKIAEKNDGNYKKNKVYNPLKLRVYVRNKLAIDDFLRVINNTQAFVNYIEGEVNYDILDDNDFPDIATTSRQNMDENDRRLIDLSTDIKKEVTKLIQVRQKISNEMKDQIRGLDNKSNNNAKEVLSRTLDKTLGFDDKLFINKVDTYELKNTILRNIQGETIKRKYRIFFSHSRKNRKIIDFFFYLLKKVGVKEEEMFYTSKDNKPEVQLKKDLAEISKQNIIDTNTTMFFYSTKDFLKSEFCMFEGGAAWATRTQKDFFITFDKHSNIPTYLKPGNEFLLGIDENTNLLTGDVYNRIIDALNFLVKHINSGREINLETLIPEFEEVNFPDKAEMRRGALPKLNEDIIFYWDTYINSGIYEEAINHGYITGELAKV
ncbi:ATP-binding protein [Enterococcus plantarum]|uniref:ATP-binding protein n=1 Tax=Enterococcus plantarum TaxID=1077675 RepID=UPI001A8E4E3B|nr:ATP-binding protein [Enterococcus plantarum]MBO0421629.1 ATP-binding protein [Enterococcus plantarum]